MLSTCLESPGFVRIPVLGLAALESPPSSPRLSTYLGSYPFSHWVRIPPAIGFVSLQPSDFLKYLEKLGVRLATNLGPIPPTPLRVTIVALSSYPSTHHPPSSHLWVRIPPFLGSPLGLECLGFVSLHPRLTTPLTALGPLRLAWGSYPFSLLIS